MLIRYVGGRSRVRISPNREAYNFTPENNRTLDIKDQRIIDYIFSLPNRAEFQAVDYIPEASFEEPNKVESILNTVNEVIKKKAGRPKKEV